MNSCRFRNAVLKNDWPKLWAEQVHCFEKFLKAGFAVHQDFFVCDDLRYFDREYEAFESSGRPVVYIGTTLAFQKPVSGQCPDCRQFARNPSNVTRNAGIRLIQCCGFEWFILCSGLQSSVMGVSS